MGLESGTYISDLVSSNPAGTDLESQGDDHLRLIKAVLQSTFPNAARAFRFMDTKASQTSTYSISESSDLHKLIPFDASGGAVTANLPATAIDGWWCIVRKTDSSANVVTLDPSGAGTINGASTITLTNQWESAWIWWDNQAGTWAFFRFFPVKPYYSGGQDIPLSDIVPSANAKRILGAATATDFSEQTIVTVLEWLGTAARGDIILRGASSFAYKNLGASGTFLKSDGTDLVYGLPLVPAYAAGTYTTNTTLSTVIPADDTIPQIGEGTEIISISITPIKASSIIKVSFNSFVGEAGGNSVIAALFKDGAANAVQASMVTPSTTNIPMPLGFEYSFSPGSTSPITLAVRVGANVGNAFVNGTGVSTRRFGGAAAATLIAQEIFTA